jgi:diadenosine tetraphosphatase ApaH/serine/threonine PP2A family protein phosphatase
MEALHNSLKSAPARKGSPARRSTAKTHGTPHPRRKRPTHPSAEIAVLSDIHSNLHALRAVVEECSRRKINRFFCLGDIVGYGANPGECVELVRSLHCATVLGNHDQYVATGTVDADVNALAKRGLEYSAEHLSKAAKRWLNSRPASLTLNGVTIVHASLHNPLDWNYLLHPIEARESLEIQTTPICFFGHTHVSKIYASPEGPRPKPIADMLFQFSKEGRSLVNPGSVGQPRGADPRAHFAVLNPAELTVEFVKLEYDANGAASAILEAGLPAFLAERLLVGR